MLTTYYQWLHGQWPSAKPEPLPVVASNGTTSIPGVYVVGDLTGVPLLKIAADSGAKAVRHICEDRKSTNNTNQVPLVIVGGGVSGYAAALEAKKQGIEFILIEAQRPLSTIENFPKEKPIFTYPSDMTPTGEISFSSDVSVKEKLLIELKKEIEAANIETRIGRVNKVTSTRSGVDLNVDGEDSISAKYVIIAIGRSGKYRTLDVVGEEKEKVVNRLHDPSIYKNKNLLVVGGGDSAVEAAIACADADARVTICHRHASFTRPKPENIEKLDRYAQEGKVTLKMSSKVTEIRDDTVIVEHTTEGMAEEIANDEVLSLIGREAPLDFFRRSGIPIHGESSIQGWFYLSLFLLAMVALYDWKNFGFLNEIWSLFQFPNNTPSQLASINSWWQTQVSDRESLLGVIAVSMKGRSFYYTLLYTSCIGVFGWMRITRRNTPYVTKQTWCLFLVQLIPLFLLPEILLPYLGYNGAFDSGIMKTVADNLFPSYISAQDLLARNWPEWGHPRAYWHAYGLILAWPLNVYNVFTPTPMTGWLIISFIQTFVLIPLLIYKYGKGAYCGWICSCGALAETMGDNQRHKMPRGPLINKLNMIGQVLLAVALVMLVIRIGGWLFPESWMHHSFDFLLKGENSQYKLVNPISWKWVVDVLAGGIIGVGFYFKYSGRVWCRFACPLAALMHIYARFSRFRILSDKKKCISCNACTSVCHQGIDIMNFANKGEPMNDPQCVRCSACVETCPTGVLSFGEIDRTSGRIISTDRLSASPVQFMEAHAKHASTANV